MSSEGRDREDQEISQTYCGPGPLTGGDSERKNCILSLCPVTDEAISHRLWLTIRKPPCGYPEAKQSIHLTDEYGRGEGWDDQGWWVEIGDLSVSQGSA